MEKEEFLNIVNRIADGTASENDIGRYNFYYNQYQKQVDWNTEELGDEEITEKKLRERIYGKINQDIPVRKIRIKKYYGVAAAVFLIVASLFLLKNQFKIDPINKQELIVNDIAPGKNTAELILDNGASVKLDDSIKGTIVNQAGVVVSKSNKGEILYAARDIERTNKVLFNTLKTPRGGQYSLTLPDGTKVWLNAASAIKFPITFDQAERVVELLEGEAYFEVAKLRKPGRTTNIPFVVKTKFQEIQVLGTHFNINAYSDEESIKTTLLEGSVKVLSNHMHTVLTPGQQTEIKSGSAIMVNNSIDIDEVMAWKNQLFYFNNTDLNSVVRQISRWYNVDFMWTSDLPLKRFNGILSKNEKLSKLLTMLEKTSGLKFKVEERRIYIMQ